MAKIEGFKIRNYRTLQDLTIGKLWNLQDAQPLTPLTAVIGKNGAGKSTLFDAFGFLADCLKVGVEEACDLKGRGGFNRLRSQGQRGPIEFEVYYKEDSNSRPITYELAINVDSTKRPYVLKERLRQRRKGQAHGWPFSFLALKDGQGVAWKEGGPKNKKIDKELDNLFLFMKCLKKGNTSDVEGADTEVVELEYRRKLGIATLGSLKQHLRIAAFRQFSEGWYLSYFAPDAARGLPLAGPQKHLNIHGDNLANVVQFMEREHSKEFKTILNRIAERIPGIHKIDTQKTPDGRLLLRFNDQGCIDPLFAQQMSDGTLKVFAYLLMLEDPAPPPFFCIEEPENGLYHKLLETLAREFRARATGKKNASQIFITTHHPYFVDALEPEEVWILEKDEKGFAKIRRASDDPLIVNMVEEGLPLGGLWYSDYLDARKS